MEAVSYTHLDVYKRQKEKDAFKICKEKIAKHGLDMKLLDAEYTFCLLYTSWNKTRKYMLFT